MASGGDPGTQETDCLYFLPRSLCAGLLVVLFSVTEHIRVGRRLYMPRCLQSQPGPCCTHVLRVRTCACGELLDIHRGARDKPSSEPGFMAPEAGPFCSVGLSSHGNKAGTFSGVPIIFPKSPETCVILEGGVTGSSLLVAIFLRLFNTYQVLTVN